MSTALSTNTETVRINIDRLWDSLEKMAETGPGIAGGCNRQALTDEDDKGRKLFVEWCQQAGLSVTVDQMGTLFASRPGSDPQAAGIYIGSHLDTQPTGGKYDGVLGVLSGLEVVRTLNDHGISTQRPIVISNWTNEEGSRFAPSMLASAVFAGVYSLEYAHGLKDQAGITLGQELTRLGWLGSEPVGKRTMHAYLEYHIEQGPILEAQHKTVGVVTHCQGQSWLEVTLTGRSAHTGSTPMTMRANAGLAMARIIDAVDHIAMAHQPNAAGSVGQIKVYPNSRNVLPAKVIFTIDIRAADKHKFDRICTLVRDKIREISHAHGVAFSIEKIGHYDPVEFDAGMTGIIRQAAEDMNYPHMDITSGAGHDATWIARVAPTAMIFCPCVGGVSHNESEAISPEWAQAGANVLLQTALQLANT